VANTVQPSCSLQHVPIDLDLETKLEPAVKSKLAFAVQKLAELTQVAAAAPGSGVSSAAAGQVKAPQPPPAEWFAPVRKGELPPPVERYWVARYSLFSRWSEGVCLNEKSLFSVTPEILAQHHAHMFRGAGVVLDAFCGCGGNAIQLALAGNQVRPVSLQALRLTARSESLRCRTRWIPVLFSHGELPGICLQRVPHLAATPQVPLRGWYIINQPGT
jgi:hypothetical protein